MAAYAYGNREEILCDLMVKRSIVKSYKVLHVDNFKSRWFVLTADYLKYCEGTLEVSLRDKSRGLELASYQVKGQRVSDNLLSIA